MFTRVRGRFLALCILVFVLALSVVPAMAQTPMTAADYLSEAQTLADDWNLLPLITVTAIVAIAAFVIKRARSAAR